LIRRGCRAVKDRRHLQAFILRYVHGWPITSNDPAKPDLVRRFKKSRWQIKNWLDGVREVMRREAEALFEELEISHVR
jgi:hypothetical protein